MRGDICAICCGTEREVTVHCPLDCEYLQEARKHEVPPVADPETFPNRDIRVSEDFLRQNEALLVVVSIGLLGASLETPDAIDDDVKQALESLVRTWRTLQTGLEYESRPENPIAAAVFDKVQAKIKEFRQRVSQSSSPTRIHDKDVLGVLAFLQRMEIQRNNGRRLGRAFIDFLREHFPMSAKEEPAPSLIV